MPPPTLGTLNFKMAGVATATVVAAGGSVVGAAPGAAVDDAGGADEGVAVDDAGAAVEPATVVADDAGEPALVVLGAEAAGAAPGAAGFAVVETVEAPHAVVATSRPISKPRVRYICPPYSPP